MSRLELLHRTLQVHVTEWLWLDELAHLGNASSRLRDWSRDPRARNRVAGVRVASLLSQIVRRNGPYGKLRLRRIVVDCAEVGAAFLLAAASPLLESVYFRNTTICDQTDAFARAFPRVRIETDWTPLHEAAFRGRLQEVQRLLRAGIYVDVSLSTNNYSKGRQTPLCYAIGSNTACVRQLIRDGANPLAAFLPVTPWSSAISLSQASTAKAIYEEAKHVVNADVGQGRTALHVAASRCDQEIVHWLVSVGAVHKSDATGATPFDLAMRTVFNGDKLSIVSLLLDTFVVRVTREHLAAATRPDVCEFLLGKADREIAEAFRAEMSRMVQDDAWL